MSSRIQELQESIRSAAEAYYQGNPIMTDQDYDALEDELRHLGEGEQVAGGWEPSEAGIATVQHATPMLSLDKIRTDLELEKFLDSGDYPVSVEYKYDGMALSIVYQDGKLDYAALRGGGEIGEIVPLADRIGGIPASIPNRDRVEVRGEAFIKFADLDRINDMRTGRGMAPYSNPRNATAGLLRNTGDVGDMVEMVSFISYDSVCPPGFISSLDHSGNRVFDQFSDVMACIEQIQEERPSLDFEIDGAVIKFQDSEVRRRLGSSRRAPNWARAWKYPPMSKTTTLREVRWSKNRTGRVVPVAIFDTVELGTNINRSTLHNYENVITLALEEGDTIVVEKAGDVIPQVVENRGGGNDPIFVPDHCPTCDSALERRSVDLACPNPDCNIEVALRHALIVLGVKGLGPSFCAKITEERGIHDNGTSRDIIEMLDIILGLTKDGVLELEGYGEVSAQNAIDALSQLREPSIGNWIAALGLEKIGVTVAQDISRAFGSLNALSEATSDDLSAIQGLGAKRIETILSARGKLDRLRAVLESHSIEEWVYDPQQSSGSSHLSGKNIVVTGTIDGMKRSEVSDLLMEQGANIQSSVNAATDILIAGSKAGSKLQRAENLGITIVQVSTSQEVETYIEG